jgi:hypothetical protein
MDVKLSETTEDTQGQSQSINFSRTKGLPTEIGVDFDAEKGLITENTEISN